VKEKGWHCWGRAAARVIYRRAISGGRPAIRLTPQASRKRLKPHRVRGRRCSDWVEAWSLSSRNGPGDDLQAPRTPDCHEPSTAISTTTTGPNVKCRVRSLCSSFAVVALIRCCRSHSLLSLAVDETEATRHDAAAGDVEAAHAQAAR
jgi:hypothetical protein